MSRGLSLSLFLLRLSVLLVIWSWIHLLSLTSLYKSSHRLHLERDGEPAIARKETESGITQYSRK